MPHGMVGTPHGVAGCCLVLPSLFLISSQIDLEVQRAVQRGLCTPYPALCSVIMQDHLPPTPQLNPQDLPEPTPTGIDFSVLFIMQHTGD